MASFMAPFPRIYFCYFEPLLLCYGGLSLIINPGHYTAALFGDLPSSDVDYLPTEKLASLNLGFMMLLVGVLVAVVMFTCENRRTAHLVALALMLSDIAHWGAVAAVLGPAGPAAIEVANWTTEMKGHMFGPVVAFSIKLAYLLGWLGDDLPAVKGKTQ
ncbi:uncharacterized protein PpBr36_09979 [Pyricularia pennisetigena]|uniref:uncharacterized protein n=1 Tax=Pyricularia pennisetigena TaxID=1578925 RepID=UPI0011531EED|nr:uncharacterized protein PpBr36_09979 [Pyricularia pennisetigena]TLS22217.1 hypothetical protein PpBr36_09979 [Pyricularia pennisetigena]